MNFFEHQDTARKKTKQLVLLYFLVVLIILILIPSILTVIFVTIDSSQTNNLPGVGQLPASAYLRFDIFAPIACTTFMVILLGTLWKLYVLKGGGSVVAESLGGRLITPDTEDEVERRLLNVVEEMALASGTAVPPVYLMDEEQGINAFAAGLTPSDAVIGVTRGTVDYLSRYELQGVIAHEFSHIFNGDMRLNLRLMGVLHGILVIAITGYFLLSISTRRRRYHRRYSSRRGDPRAAMMIIGLVLMTLGYIGVFFGRMIKSAVSRQREFLADASAVQFTRYPEGLSGALQRIAGLSYGSRIESTHAEEASHLFFSNGVKNSLSGLLSTHPPLQERILRIDPSFQGAIAEVDPTAKVQLQEHSAFSQFSSAGGGAAAPQESQAVHSTPKTQTTGSEQVRPNAENVEQSIGNPSAQHLTYVQSMLAEIPDSLREASHHPFSAGALIFSLLLDEDKKASDVQILLLTKKVEGQVLKEVLRFQPEIQKLPAKTRLPLIDLCLPALKKLSKEQFSEFEQTVQALITADKKLSLFEYALARVVMNNLEWAFGATPKTAPCHSLKDCSEELEKVLSVLAWLDTRSEAQANAAFKSATQTLSLPLTLHPKGASNLQSLDQALRKIAHSDFSLRQQVLKACIKVMLHDEVISIAEAELLRAISAALDCPMPPILNQ